MIFAFGSFIWNVVLALIGIIVAVILLFLIGDATYTIYQQYKKHRMTHVHTGPWTEYDEMADLYNECQTLDKIMKKVDPDWYKNNVKDERWTSYMNVLNSKDGDDNGTQKD